MMLLCVAAQTGAPGHSPPSIGAEIQLHSYLEHAAEAMHQGDLDSAARALRRSFPSFMFVLLIAAVPRRQPSNMLKQLIY
jgi:hypothetical protein